MGGIPKEDDFSEISLFKKKILKIIVYGKASDKIYNSLSNEINVEKLNTLKTLFIKLLIVLLKVVSFYFLLHASSFDQFSNYEERGKKFKNIVERYYA